MIAEKVTAFITRRSKTGHELLLFEHPYAGIEIPAGTVEDGETPEEAAMREATEESGLTSLTFGSYLGSTVRTLPQGQRIVVAPTRVYARPDVTSFDWAYLRGGIQVTVRRKEGTFSQITYEELDQLLDPQYVTMCITGWVPDSVLSGTEKRHYFHLEFRGRRQDRWTVRTDNHLFTLFWAPLSSLPDIIPFQVQWLEWLLTGSSLSDPAPDPPGECPAKETS
jgi:8-oxo-dGTP pyrophosphatase MutT (NUDIX family)